MKNTGLIGERIALDFESAMTAQKVGDYTILGSPNDLKIPDSFMETVKELGDDKPMFVTVAVPIGKSRILSSDPSDNITHRIWPEHVMDSLVSRIRESGLPGYRGHDVTLDNVPDTSVMWVSATKGEKVTGERAVLARGYVFNVDNNRYFLKAGAFNTVSPMAVSRTKPEVDNGSPAVLVEQANFLSLDWVRPMTEGIRGAEIISKEGASSTMVLTPEERKLITELGLSTLQELNPALVSEIAKNTTSQSNTENGEIISQLTDRVQKLTREVATLAIEKSVLDQVATVLGCQSSELVGKIAELKTLQTTATKVACEVALSKLGDSPLRDVVKKRLEGREFSNPKEAEDAVTAEVATAKEYIAALGNNLSLGSVRDTGSPTGGDTGILSTYGKSFMGRAN